MKKLKLNADDVAVDSFPTGGARAERRGTVRGAAGCTYQASCLCPSAYYYCGDGYQTLYSCDYSKEQVCVTSYYNC